MTRIRLWLALALGLSITAETPAQFLPVIGLPTIGQAGISIRAGGRHLRVEGFIPLGDPYPAIIPVTPTPKGFQQVGPAIVPWSYGYPYYYGYPYFPPVAPGFPFPGYGSINQRVTVQIINPPGLAPGVGLRPIPDTSGIDLDLQPASAIWGEKRDLAKGKGPANKGEIVQAPAKDEKKVEIARAEDKKPQAAANQAKPAVAAAKPEPPPNGQKRQDMGVAAFRNGDFGVALARFRQAVDDDRPAPRALFLLAQASLAVGRYDEAFELIQQGLQARPDWPSSGFHPRLELYDKHPDAWKDQRERLEQAQARNPKNADYLFLVGYVAWFEGQRAVAVDYFQRAKALAADARAADLFLKAAKN